MNKNMLAVALASLLVGGVAVAAYNSFADDDRVDIATASDAAALGLDADLVEDGAIDGIEYADVVNVEPVSEKQALYATVIGTDPISETSTVSSPREVCEDVVVQERLPERDGNVGGTVAGALIGGLVGNRVDRRHVGGRVVERVDRQCRTVSDTSQSSRVVGYNVTYRNPDGTTGTMRTGSKPGSRISLGSEDQVVGYDVTYRYGSQQQTIRMDDEPGDRLPVIDGQVVTRTALVTENDRG